MPDVLPLLLIGLIVFCTNFQEGITGFGCTALALPFVTLILGDLELAKHVLVPIAWSIALFIVIVSRKQIIWREYGRIVLIAFIGLPVGIYISKNLPKDQLQLLLAVFMLLIGIHGLARQASRSAKIRPAQGAKRMLLSGLIPLGGLMQGAFGSGGPLVVVYATRTLMDKSIFRATLCLVWITLNTVLISSWVLDRSMADLNLRALRIIAVCVPFTVAGILLGNVAHNRVNEVTFRRVVYTVLMASGLVLGWSLLRG